MTSANPYYTGEGLSSNLTKVLNNNCIIFPPFVNSNGIWAFVNGAKNDKTQLEASLPLLELQVFVAFSFSHASHFVLKRIGIPMLVSQIVAGLLIRQAADAMNVKYRLIMFSPSSLDTLDIAASLGYMFFLFLMGVKMDMKMIFKTGKKTWFTAILAILIPLILGSTMVPKVSQTWGLHKDDKSKLLTVIIEHSKSSFPVISCLLSDLKILNSELGRMALSCALICDIVGLVLTRSAIWTRAAVSMSHKKFFLDLGLIFLFVIVLLIFVRPVMYWVVKQTPEGRPVKDLHIQNIIILAIAFGFFSYVFGQYVVFGPFVLGLVIPDGPPLGSALVDRLEPIVSGFLIPLFVVTCMLRVNLLDLKFDDNLMKSTAVIVAVVQLTKFIAVLIPPLICKVPKRDAVVFAFIMSCNGIVEMTIYTVYRDQKVVTDQMFSFIIISILLTLILVAVSVRLLYDPSRKYAGYQKRNIMHTKANGELRMLACIYRPDDIPAAINLLEAICDTGGSPLAVYVLHLISLHGQAIPMFISHKIQTKTVSNRSYSENVILSFKSFEQKYSENVFVDPYTAISPLASMHEDICTLALDKLASLVILPFHRKWFNDGSIESEDKSKRDLNCRILERSPCSVGILIDRPHFLGNFCSRESLLEKPIFVVMFFFGGSDDREALTLAKRMSQNTSINLTVVRFVASTDEIGTDWEKVLDSEVLKDVKPEMSVNKRVTYVMEMVKDGRETMEKIISVTCNSDLVIVGRRKNIKTPQTSSLEDYNKEFSELGVIGNFLVTRDIHRRCSILVVQQQQTK